MCSHFELEINGKDWKFEYDILKMVFSHYDPQSLWFRVTLTTKLNNANKLIEKDYYSKIKRVKLIEDECDATISNGKISPSQFNTANPVKSIANTISKMPQIEEMVIDWLRDPHNIFQSHN